MGPEWLKKAVFYEIYPQSFQDSNGDGIGDFRGIEQRLDYLDALGVNAIWMNPCFDSSFFDAGYDVRDYFKTAPRYGSNEDLKELLQSAHRRGMHVLLDLVPGHTAVDHPWFIESCRDEKNECSDRYIWRSGGPWGQSYQGIASFLCGISERPGAVAVNCFSTQPALNYGFGQVTEDWQFPADSPEAEKTRLLMEDIMRFWLESGCDGFRVDMAASLVKEDPGQKCTMRIWRKIRAFLDREFPEAVLISEWGDPKKALKAGFHMDFLLHGGPTHYMDLFRRRPYFSSREKGDLTDFVQYYESAWTETSELGLICIPSGNHDMVRMRETLTQEEMKVAFVFLLTMPGCPFIYYGDEIGMRYVHGLKSKEGGYERTGSRTPMQWDHTKNCGFSSADREALYLPVDPDSDCPCVETQLADCSSLLNHVKTVTAFRQEHSALSSDSHFRFHTDGSGYPLVYERWDAEERLIVAINPSENGVEYSSTFLPSTGRVLMSSKNAVLTSSAKLILPGCSFAILEI